MSTKQAAAPITLNDFKGQPQAIAVLKDMIGYAKSTDQAVGHFLLYGGPGLGKTTLGRIIAREMGGICHTKMAQDFSSPEEILVYIACFMKPKDILLLDEVHGIKKSVEESLFHYMETREVDTKVRLRDLPQDKQKSMLNRHPGLSPTSEVALKGKGPSVTIIGATTNPELLLGPFTDRFQSLVELKPYTNETLAEIIGGIGEKNGIQVDHDVAIAIAQRCRGAVRIAHNIISSCRDHLVARDLELIISKEILEEVMGKHGVDPYGLRSQDRAYLRILADRKDPIGSETLARRLGFRSTKTLDNIIEPYLMKHGWVEVNNGRYITDSGRRVLAEVQNWE